MGTEMTMTEAEINAITDEQLDRLLAEIRDTDSEPQLDDSDGGDPPTEDMFDEGGGGDGNETHHCMVVIAPQFKYLSISRVTAWEYVKGKKEPSYYRFVGASGCVTYVLARNVVAIVETLEGPG